MSLRARLIVAMAVVGIVLVLAAIAITRTTESYLVRQLDDRLAETASTSERFGPDRGPGPPIERGPQTENEQQLDPGPFSTFFIAHYYDNGVPVLDSLPNTSGDSTPLPDIPIDACRRARAR